MARARDVGTARLVALAPLLLLLAPPPILAAGETTPLDKRLEDPVGEDPTRPRPEMLFRYEFRNAPGRAPDTVHAFLLEGLTRIPVNERWAARVRLEMPLVLTNLPSDDDPDETWRFGSGDLLSEVDVIRYLNERWAIAAGAQVLFPTASRDVTGDDSWNSPSARARCCAPCCPRSAPTASWRRTWSTPSTPAGRRPRSRRASCHLQPLLHWAPTSTLFFELFPAADIVVNLTDAAHRGRLFFPFNALAGILLTPKVVTSLEIGVPIVKDYPLYDFKLQAAVGYFFD